MKQHIKSVVVLVCICAAVAVMLAVTNAITAPIIAENLNSAANQALLEVMPDGKDFEKIDISKYTLPATVTEAYKEASGGYVVRLTVKGYKSDIEVMVGVKADGTVSGVSLLQCGDTWPDKVEKYGINLVGKDSASIDAVDTESGMTVSSGAYRGAVKDALGTAIILGGGSVDLRDEEEILQDNLAAALPAGEGKFQKLLIVEVIDDVIDAVYKAENGKGYVVIVGEQFIGVAADGVAVGELDTELKTKVEAAVALISATTTTDIDLTAYEGLAKAVLSAKKTATGNYIIEVRAAGYGINGEYHASNEYIYIQVSITSEGKIIDCLTVSQKESANLGDACAKEEFYGQFDGKTEDDYNNIDAISGATVTTDGYLKAIERVFDAVKIFDGGANNEE